MNDDLLRPPPERDVSVQLRAQVLGRALDPATPVRHRRPLMAPVLAGLTAAAVVVGVIFFLDQGGPSASPGPAGRGVGVRTEGPVGNYQKVDVDLRALREGETLRTRESCTQRRSSGKLTKQILAKRLQLSPMTDVKIPVLAYGHRNQSNVSLCTPYQVSHLHRIASFVPTSDPVHVLKGTHVRAMVASSAGGPSNTYVDGAWFNVNQSIARIEIRVDVGTDLGEWYSTQRHADIMFASGWRTLTDAQATAPVKVEYRAVTVDGDVIALDSIGGTVTPSDQSAVTPVQVPHVPH